MNSRAYHCKPTIFLKNFCMGCVFSKKGFLIIFCCQLDENSDLEINLTPERGGVIRPYQKMASTPKNNDPKEPKLCDFSFISMTNPSIPFWGLKMAKKGFL